jgi:DNA-binding transcriptional regulator GbsR (MarR family)
MSQQDIFNLLQRKRKPLCVKDISRELGISKTAISKSTRNMVNFNLINVEVIRKGKHKQRTPYFKLF